MASRRVLKTSKLINIPKGWQLKSDVDKNKFCLIMKGSFRYDYGLPQNSLTQS